LKRSTPQNAKCRNPRSSRCSAASRAISASSVSTHGNAGTSRAALKSTVGKPVFTTAAAIRGVSMRAMIPSPFHPASHGGGSSPRPCSIT
jgi:hypothetical protein